MYVSGHINIERNKIADKVAIALTLYTFYIPNPDDIENIRYQTEITI